MAKKLTPAQMKIAKLAKPFDKITKEDFAVLRSKRGTKVKGEAKKPMQFGDKKIKGEPIKPMNFGKPKTDIEKLRSGKQSEIAELRKKYPTNRAFQEAMKKQAAAEKQKQQNG